MPSSVAAGTVMKGLNFMKTKQDPVALEDEEYPAWLWGVLEEVGGKGRDGEGVEEGDLFGALITSSLLLEAPHNAIIEITLVNRS